MTDVELARAVWRHLTERAKSGMPASLPWEKLAEALDAWGDRIDRAVRASRSNLAWDRYGNVHVVASKNLLQNSSE